MNAQYTLGRSYGDSTGSNEADTVGNNARNLADFAYDESYNKFDVRHNFNASLVYARSKSELTSPAEYFLMNALPFPVHLLRRCPEDAENIFGHRKGRLAFARKYFISAGMAHDSGFS